MNRQFSIFSLACAMLCAACSLKPDSHAVQADFKVIPLPQQIVPQGKGAFALTDHTRIVYPAGNEELRRNAVLLADYIRQQTGLELLVTDETVSSSAIVLGIGLTSDNMEAYELNVNEQQITINGASANGLFYGIQTLRKALPSHSTGEIAVPLVQVKDEPRFAYRGAHLDVSRHFFSVDSIKRYVDMLALHNINRFHWHLTDDQGWRIEIKSRPKLTETGAWRKGTVIGRNSGTYEETRYGGYYTQEEIRDIVEYAARHYVTVIPEIDLPGHMQAALAAYPELGCTGGPYEVWKQWGVSDDVLCAGNEQIYGFIEDVLAEVAELFPSEYIHIGGDECPKVRWEKCPKCQQRIRKLGLQADGKHTSGQRLQSYVIHRAEEILNRLGRRMIGWDETLEGGLAPNATVMSWRGTEAGVEAARLGHDAIMTPTAYMYFDYYQTLDVSEEPLAIGGYVPLEKVYSFEPVPSGLSEEEAAHIIGVQANLWTEYIPTFRQVEYMELPRMAALSEVQWRKSGQKDYAAFLKRLPGLLAIYDVNGYHYARHIFDVSASYRVDTVAHTINVELSTFDDAPVYYTLDGSEPDAGGKQYREMLRLNESVVLKAVAIRKAGKSRVLTETVSFNKATAKPLTLLQPVNEKYQFGGVNTLVDGLNGTLNYRTGRWIAFYKNDLEIVADLKKKTSLRKAWVRNYVEIGEEILDARSFVFLVSDDGKLFREVKSAVYPAVTIEDKNGAYLHELNFEPVKARYVKWQVSPEYQIPSWHWGKGRPAFIFVDEIGVE